MIYDYQGLNRLNQLGILEQVNYSVYASPIVRVLKHDSKIRLCADYSVSLDKQLIIYKHPNIYNLKLSGFRG